MLCPKCGNEFEGNFCPECGTPIQTQTVQQTTQPNYQQMQYGTPTTPRKKKHTGLFIIGGVILLFIIIGIASNQGGGASTSPSAAPANVNKTSSAESSKAKASSATEKANFYNVGQPAKSNGITMTLDNVTENKGSEYNKPSDGKIFAICEFTIDNQSSKDLAISSVLCFEAYVDGFSTDQSLTGLQEAKGKTQLDGKIAAGKKMNGVIAYEVPTDWKELEIQVDPDVMSFFSGKTVFKATKSK